MTDLNNIARKFRINHIEQQKFNVGIKLAGIDLNCIKILNTIQDIQLYSFNDADFSEEEKIYNIKNLSKYFNEEYDISIGLKNMYLIITNDIDMVKLTEPLNIKTFLITKEKISHKNTETFSDNFPKSIVKVKQATDNYRVKCRENYLLECIRKAQNFKNKTDSLNSIHKIYTTLFEETCKKIYLDSIIKTLKKLENFPEEKTSALASMAIDLGLYKGEVKKAINLYKKLIPDIMPQDRYLLYGYACLNCKDGNFKEFKKYYNERFLGENEKLISKRYNKPFWSGEKNVSDKILLIFAEHGYGDNFLFLQHIEKLTKIFKQIKLYARKGCYDLLIDNFPNIEIYQEYQKANTIQFDYFITTMSIPLNLNILPPKYQKRKWIKPNKQKVKEFKKYFDKNKFNIGVFWDSTRNKLQRWSDLGTFMPLAYLDKVQLYSLHIDKEDIELNYLDNSVHIENLGKHFKNFSDTAAAIENCDLIISTDSVILNLAGAMGKKTFGLFPQFAEFRWYKLEGEDVGWYKSVKPFHAEYKNDFRPEIAKICEEVKELVKQKFSQ